MILFVPCADSGLAQASGDLTDRLHAYTFPTAFRNPRWSAVASKLRVIETVAPDAFAGSEELLRVHGNFYRRPHGL